MTIDIEGMSALEDFEVIEIVDESNPYPALIGIDWATDMNGVINLKKQKMTFEKKSLYVVVHLDPTEGPCYTEPVCDYESGHDLDQISKIMTRDQDWVNPTTDGRIAWDHKISCTSNSNEELEHWKNRLHEVSMLCCNMMTKWLRYVSSEVRILPYYDFLTDIDKFLDAFERGVPEKHFFHALDLVLCAMLARWFGTHKDSFDDWHIYKKMM